jgi:predicted metal-dependent peptidase
MSHGVVFEECEVTPAQKKQWEDTVSLMGWKAPGFRHIFYRMLSQGNGELTAIFTKVIPTAATDGFNILVNPEWFFKLTLMERVFVTAHEILHNIYSDVELLHRCAASKKVPMTDGSSLPFEEDVMQLSADYRSNALLIQSKIGNMPKSYDHNGKTIQCGAYDPAIAGPNDSIYDVYKKVYKQKKANKNKLSGQGFDVLLAPGKSMGKQPQQAANSRNGQQWAIELSIARDLQQRAQGTMAGCLSRMFQDILEPKVPWTEHIRTLFARKIGQGNYDWRRPDRRFLMQDIHMPSRRGASAGWLAIWGDTSGSISHSDFRKYFGEFMGIVEEMNPRRLTAYWCDSRIHQVDEIAEPADLETLRHKGVKDGGGGTSMMPVLDEIAKEYEQPEALICFTDGYVTFPSIAPSYPIIWAMITDLTPPFGDVVRLK